MLSSPKNDLLHLLNILEATEKIKHYAKDSSDAESFYYLNDQLNFNASLTLLANIGESVSHVSNTLKTHYPDTPWQTIKNFRNNVVHNYHGLDIFIVFDIIQQNLPLLQEQLLTIISECLQQKIFDQEEFEVAQTSYHYRHIPFELIKT